MERGVNGYVPTVHNVLFTVVTFLIDYLLTTSLCSNLEGMYTWK